MTLARRTRIGVAAALIVCLVGGAAAVMMFTESVGKTTVVAYFDNSNGIFPGDDVMILGVAVGTIDSIEPQPTQAKITFSFDDQYQVPADAKAVILNPTLVTARAIQLTPAYTTGPVMESGATIPLDRTAVPVEFDDLRAQLEKLTDSLQPTEPGGVSTLGSFINTAADNLRGQGANIRDALIQLSQTFSALGDHSGDLFGTIRNLSLLVDGLQSSEVLLRELNGNLSTVTSLVANDPNEIDNAIADLGGVLGQVRSFVADNREPLGTSFDRLSSISAALGESLEDVKQTLHVAPTAIQNFVNIYEPSNGALTGVLSANNFANPITFLCGAIQAASRLNNEQSAKLCVQYLAPIIKNRQYNFPPLGLNPFVGAQARPNEVTFSEDWLRDLTEAGRVQNFYDGLAPADPAAAVPEVPAVAPDGSLPAEAPLAAEVPAPDGTQVPAVTEPVQTDPGTGLPGMMLPTGQG